MAGKVKPLDLVIRGVNRIRGPIREANAQIDSMLKPVRRVQSAMRSLSREARLPQLMKATKGITTELAALGSTALYGAAGVFAMAAGMRKFIDIGDDIGGVAVKLGMTTDAVQELRYAAAQLDVEQGTLDASMETFQKNLVDVGRGSSRALFAFRAVGIPPEKVRQIRDTGKLFELFTAGLQGIQDPAERSRVALAAFGNVDMVQMLGAGVDKIRELRAEAQALGLVMDEETIKLAGDADNELRKLGASFRGVGYEVGASLLPMVVEASEGMRAWLKENRPFIKETIVPTIQGIGKVLGFVVPIIAKAATSTAGLTFAASALAIKAFGPLTLAILKWDKAMLNTSVRVLPTMWKGVQFLGSSIFNLASKALPLLIAGVRALGVAAMTNPIGLVIAAVGALIIGGVVLYKTYKPFRDLLDAIWDRISRISAKAAFDFVDFGFGGPKAETAEEARAATAAGARAYSSRPQGNWSANLGIQVGVAPGATASVTSMQSSTPAVALETGQVMPTAY